MPTLRTGVATTETTDGLVLLDEHTGRYWQLNPNGSRVLAALLAGDPPGRIAQDFAARYRISLDQAQQDVTAVTDLLYSSNLVQAR
jgi:hypothetical protein